MSFDPMKMYTVLCDLEYRPESIVWILYFPGVAVQTAVPVYMHRCFRHMCGSVAGRGSSIGTATRRTTVAGPNNTNFDYTEFPTEAYARSKNAVAPIIAPSAEIKAEGSVTVKAEAGV